MYFDSRPCEVCGSEVELDGSRTVNRRHEPDATIDERVCANAGCPTNSGGPDAPSP